MNLWHVKDGEYFSETESGKSDHVKRYRNRIKTFGGYWKSNRTDKATTSTHVQTEFQDLADQMDNRFQRLRLVHFQIPQTPVAMVVCHWHCRLVSDCDVYWKQIDHQKVHEFRSEDEENECGITK